MKASTLLFAATLFILTSCGSEQVVHMDMKVQEVIEYFDQQNKRVITFVGYSGAGYADEAKMLEIAAEELDKLNPSTTIINIGATPDGIGKVYELAKARGMMTTGIVSTQAIKYEAEPSPFVDEVFYIEDDIWGGYEGDSQVLSPTSTTLISVSDEIVGIGGGDIAKVELEVAKKLNKVVRTYPADKRQ